MIKLENLILVRVKLWINCLGRGIYFLIIKEWCNIEMIKMCVIGVISFVLYDGFIVNV